MLTPVSSIDQLLEFRGRARCFYSLALTINLALARRWLDLGATAAGSALRDAGTRSLDLLADPGQARFRRLLVLIAHCNLRKDESATASQARGLSKRERKKMTGLKAKENEAEEHPEQLGLQAADCQLENMDGMQSDLEGLLGLKDDGINCLKWNTTAVAGVLVHKERTDATAIVSRELGDLEHATRALTRTRFGHFGHARPASQRACPRHLLSYQPITERRPVKSAIFLRTSRRHLASAAPPYAHPATVSLPTRSGV